MKYATGQKFIDLFHTADELWGSNPCTLYGIRDGTRLLSFFDIKL